MKSLISTGLSSCDDGNDDVSINQAIPVINGSILLILDFLV
jgi:hypothetical protein